MSKKYFVLLVVLNFFGNTFPKGVMDIARSFEDRINRFYTKAAEFHSPIIKLVKPFNKKRSAQEFERLEKELKQIVNNFQISGSTFDEFFAGEVYENFRSHPFVWYYRKLQKDIRRLSKFEKKRLLKKIAQINRKIKGKRVSEQDKKEYQQSLNFLEETKKKCLALSEELEKTAKYVKSTDSYMSEIKSYSQQQKLSSINSDTRSLRWNSFWRN